MPLEKTQENLTTCQICKRIFKNKISTGIHITRTHKLSSKEYYDIYYKAINEEICQNCGKNTNYDPHYGYRPFCSYKCANSNSLTRKKIEQTNIKKYGTINIMHNSNFVEKVKLTNLKKYGVNCVLKNNNIKNKIKDTNFKKYGCENPFQNDEIKKKIKQSRLIKYGVEHVLQNKELCEKAHKTSKQAKPYSLPSGKIIKIQGYEPQFLNYVFKNNILKENEIVYHPEKIQYVGKDYELHYYFPDFYIPKWNLIIEIKSDWMLQYDKNVHLKEITTRGVGYNYIRILNFKNTKTLNFTDFLISIPQSLPPACKSLPK